MPSGKFKTNALIMALGAFAYNILRLIGQLGLLGNHSPVRHPAKRRRIKNRDPGAYLLGSPYDQYGTAAEIAF